MAPRPAHWIALTALAALLLVPVAGAFEAQGVRAESGGADLEDASLLAMQGRGFGAVLGQLDITAANIEVWAYERKGLHGAYTPPNSVIGSGYWLDTVGMTGTDPEVYPAKDAVLSLELASDTFVANAFSEQPFKVHLVGNEITIDSLRDPLLDSTGIMAANAAQRSVGGPGEATYGSTFTPIRLDGTHVHGTSEVSTDVAVRGDFVLELEGMDVRLTTPEEDRVILGTTEQSAWTGVGAVDDQAHERVERFLRVFVTAGTLHVALEGETTEVAWISSSATAWGDAGLQVIGVGVPRSVEEPAVIVVGPTGDIMVTPAEEVPTATQVKPLSSELSLIFLFGSLALLSLVATILLAIRVLRAIPSMEEVEGAIEGGKYRRAARLAASILRRRPGMEAAALSRAIALSRNGEPGRVIDELERFIDRRRPQDGSLHYVLGLAYLDLGHADKARTVLHEAARRTPDLGPQVEARLRGTTPPTPMVTREGSAYA